LLSFLVISGCIFGQLIFTLRCWFSEFLSSLLLHASSPVFLSHDADVSRFFDINSCREVRHYFLRFAAFTIFIFFEADYHFRSFQLHASYRQWRQITTPPPFVVFSTLLSFLR